VAERLGDSDAAVRRAAAEALGHLGDRGVLPALERTFRDAPPELRETIAESVGRLDPEALPNLVDLLLASGDVTGKLGVIRVLRNSGALPAGGGDVLSALAADADPLVRADALEALARLEDGAAAGRTAPRAEAGLGDPDERVRVSAVNAVLHRRIEALGPRLLALLGEDPSPVVRERAALAVGALRVPGGERVLLAACRRDEPLAVRAAAVLALGGYESETMVGQVLAMSDETEVRLELQERIRTDPEYRGLARALRGSRHVELRALAAGSRREMETSLAEGMRSSLDVRERTRLVLGLVAFQGEQSKGALLQVVRGDPSPEVRAAALSALGGLLEGGALLDVARRALGDPSTAVRHAAVELFRRLPAEQALPGLIQALRADDDPAVLQAVAAQAEAAFDTFVDLALGVDLSGREAVALTLVARWIHHPRLAALLAPLGRSAAPEVRQALAALWIARPDLGDPRGLAALAADPVVGVRRMAARAAAAAREHGLLVDLAADPDAGLRAEVARLLRPAAGVAVPIALHDDPEEEVRAAAFVVRLLRGEIVSRPADVRREAAAAAVHESVRVEDLRAVARTAPDQRERLAAALALALVGDETAHEVAAHDPVPAIRTQVAGMLNGGERGPA